MRSEQNRHLKTIFAIAIFLFAVMWFFKDSLLTGPARLLMADTTTPVIDGEIGALLMGDRTGERVQSALEFLSTNPNSSLLLAPEEATPLIAAGYYPHAHSVHKKYLIEAGVKEERILIPDCYNTSTYDEAVCFRDYLTTHLPATRSIVVITSWYHSGRAVWTFEKAFKNTAVSVKAFLPARPDTSPDQWWKAEYKFLAVFNEYLKWTYWLLKTD